MGLWNESDDAPETEPTPSDDTGSGDDGNDTEGQED